LTAEGVAEEIERSLANAGIPLELARAVFKAGKPTDTQRRVRDRIAFILRPIWARRVKRAYIAEVLGVSDRALRNLMN
jgi:hypothetical protein